MLFESHKNHKVGESSSPTSSLELEIPSLSIPNKYLKLSNVQMLLFPWSDFNNKMFLVFRCFLVKLNCKIPLDLILSSGCNVSTEAGEAETIISQARQNPWVKIEQMSKSQHWKEKQWNFCLETPEEQELVTFYILGPYLFEKCCVLTSSNRSPRSPDCIH